MAKATRIRFLNTFFEAGLPKYLAGQHYPKTPETHAQALAGNAEEIEVEEEAPAAPDPKAKGSKKTE